VLGVVLLIIDALQERQRREAGAATHESGSAEALESHGDDEAADYPDDVSDEASTHTDLDSDADDSVSDDHNTR
jgi:hypothetical protein